MKNNPLKVIIDTNLWISFLISRNFVQLDKILFEKKCRLIFSEELLEEFLTVIKKPKLRRFFSEEDTVDLIENIQEYAEFVGVQSKVEVCRDEKDNFLLALAQDSEADFLISGDADLLSMGTYKSTKIVKIAQFLEQEL